MKSSILSYFLSYISSKNTFDIQQSNNSDRLLDISFRAETILIEEYRRASIASYRSNDEITSSFNVYLILIGILVTISIALETLSSQIQLSNLNFVDILYIYLDLLASILLILGGIVSVLFLNRIIDLSFGEFKSLQLINKIKKFYINQYNDRLPLMQELLKSQDDAQVFRGIPPYIRHILIFTISVLWAGASFILFGYILLYIYTGEIITPRLRDTKALAFSLTYIIIVFATFLCSFILIQIYYKRRLKKVSSR